jgi:hypothetical protein
LNSLFLGFSLGNQRKTKDNYEIHPAPNQSKPKEIKGNHRIPKGKMRYIV